MEGEFRRPRAEDRAAFEHLQRRGYASGAATLHRPEQAPVPAAPTDGRADQDDGARAYFVDGRPVAGAYVKRYETIWGSDSLPMESVGGVVALPEVRRRGYTAAVLTRLLADMRERGVPISTITTPFSYAFYRHMGWEYAFRRVRARFAPALARRIGAGAAGEAHFVRCGPEPEWWPSDIDAVYRQVMQRRYQGAALRGADLWRARLRGDRTYAYVVDGAGGPAGYLICALGERNSLRVRELFALDRLALRQLFHLLFNFDSQADSVEWDMPPDVRLDRAVSEQHELKLQWRPQGMFRLVDVSAAVVGRMAPGLSGCVCLRLEDAQAPWNRGPHWIEWLEGRAGVRATAGAGERAHAAMDQRVFAQIFAGALTPHEAVEAGLAEIGTEALRVLTEAYVTGRPPLLLEWF